MTDFPASRCSRATPRFKIRTRAVMSAALIDSDFSTSTSTSQKFLRYCLWIAARCASLMSGKTLASCSSMTLCRCRTT